MPHRRLGGFSFSWSPALSPALLSNSALPGSLRRLPGPLRLFGSHADRPDKPEQFSSQRHHNLVLVLAARGHGFVAFVQPLLGLPGDGFDFVADGQVLLPAEQDRKSTRL